MQRLIDKDRLSAEMYHEAFETNTHWQTWNSGCWIRYRLFEEVLKRQPTVEAVPVRHGHWIKDDTGAEYCSNCHEYPYDDGEYHIANWHSNYCPNCGAKMDEAD